MHYMNVNFITYILHPGCNGCNYTKLHEYYMPGKMLMWYIALHDMFISVLGPCRGCILRPAGPPECGAFAARLNAAHFTLLQQQVKHKQVY